MVVARKSAEDAGWANGVPRQHKHKATTVNAAYMTTLQPLVPHILSRVVAADLHQVALDRASRLSVCIATGRHFSELQATAARTTRPCSYPSRSAELDYRQTPQAQMFVPVHRKISNRFAVNSSSAAKAIRPEPKMCKYTTCTPKHVGLCETMLTWRTGDSV